MLKRLLYALMLAGVLATGAFAQTVQKIAVSDADDLVSIQFSPIKSATCTSWIDISKYGSTTHTLTFTYRTQPTGVTISLKTSLTYGASTATTDTSTSTTGDTIQRTGTTANAIQVCVSGLTGSVDVRPVYRGTDNAVQSNESLANIEAALTNCSRKRYISVGSTEDESQVKATSGTLCSISAWNFNTTTDAFIKCTNATAANTTPGSTAVWYSMIIPHGSGFVEPAIFTDFDTALTCYLVTGKADTDVAEVGANDVGYNLRYK